MVNRPRSITVTVCISATLGFAQTGAITPTNSILDGTRAAQVEAPKPALTAEARGDILMARKMYREAIEAFSEGSPKDAVLRNKIGIAHHQLMQLDTARKYDEQAVKLKPDYSEPVNNLGTVHYATQSYRPPISHYTNALTLPPHPAP